MHFEYKGHFVSIEYTLDPSHTRIRIDDGVTADFYGSDSDAISSAKQWIDVQEAK
jgi:hypothetical protein